MPTHKDKSLHCVTTNCIRISAMTRSVSIASALLALLPTLSIAREIPRQAVPESYDYIIVGAGTGGLTVANRLSEDSSKLPSLICCRSFQISNNTTDATVLVIEAGPLCVFPPLNTIG